jgi:hypothetical protein
MHASRSGSPCARNGRRRGAEAHDGSHGAIDPRVAAAMKVRRVVCMAMLLRGDTVPA